jgi:hypothetical protein
MTIFRGTFEDFQEKVMAAGCRGVWSDISHGKQFRTEAGTIMNWFPGTGTVQFQGAEADRDILRSALDAGIASPPPGGDDRTQPTSVESASTVQAT